MSKKIFKISLSFFLMVFVLAVVAACNSKGGKHGETAIEQVVTDTTNVGSIKCIACHGVIDTLKMAGFHNKLDCETCHGPGSMHLSDPIVYKMKLPRERTGCTLCHSSATPKVAGAKQIDQETHNPGSRCIKCHDPHQTGFGRLAGHDAKAANSSTCNVCHAKINTLRLKGVHKTVECESCHDGWQKHLDNPKATKPKKSSERAFCGKCHGKGLAPASDKIKQVDLKEHNTEAKCVECHNPHSPWD